MSGQSRVALHPFVSTSNHNYQHQQGRRLFDMVGWGRRCLQIACGWRSDKVFSKWPATSKTRAGLALSPDTTPSTAATWPQVRLPAARAERWRSLQLVLIDVTLHQHRQLGTANIHPV